MTHSSRSHRFLWLAAAATLGACNNGPPFDPPNPSITGGATTVSFTGKSTPQSGPMITVSLPPGASISGGASTVSFTSSTNGLSVGLIPQWCADLLANWVAGGTGAPPSLDCGNIVTWLPTKEWTKLIGGYPSDLTCIRDGDVIAAALSCWGALCVQTMPPPPQAPPGYQQTQAADYLASAQSNICSALDLCSDAPCVSTDPDCPVPCLTLPMFPCPGSNGAPGGGLTCQ